MKPRRENTGSPGSDTRFSLSEERKEILLNLVLVGISISLVFAGLEAGLRAGVIPYDRGVRSEETFCDAPETYHQFHPEYGWTLTPDSEYIRHWQIPGSSDQWMYYHVNEEGFRDTFDSGERNVIVVGDSFTESGGVTQGGQYTHLLDRWTPNTSIRTFGVGGYGTDQELLIYRDVSERYDHELVVLAYYFGNDAKNNAGQGWPPGPRRPHFELRDGRLVQVHEPVDEIPPDAAGFRDMGPIRTLHDRLQDYSYAYHFVYTRGKTAAANLGIVGDSRRGPPTPPSGEELDSQLRLTRALVNEFGREARSNGATVLIVGIPARGEVTPSNPAHYPADSGRRYYQAQREMLREVATNRSNVEYLDLRPALEREVTNGRQVYGQKVANAHFIAHGYKVVAKTIYRNMTAEGYVPNRSVDFEADYRQFRKSC